MKQRLGFTIVEVIVVVTAIAILAGIGTVTYTGLQRQAREDERVADMDVVASYIETHHERTGSYLSITNFYHGESWGDTQPFVLSEGIPVSALTSPSTTTAIAPLYSFPSRSDVINSQANFTTLVSSNSFDYVYMPYTASGTPCRDTTPLLLCSRYSLFYKDEQGVMQEVKSKYGN